MLHTSVWESFDASTFCATGAAESIAVLAGLSVLQLPVVFRTEALCSGSCDCSTGTGRPEAGVRMPVSAASRPRR